MYQRVQEDEKLMMGMSLAYSLFYPQEVKDQLQVFKTRELPQPNVWLAVGPPSKKYQGHLRQLQNQLQNKPLFHTPPLPKKMW